MADKTRHYRDKRDPTKTGEPFGAARDKGGATSGGRFVVHLHAARRRHYDLRLQIGAVLASFAVPKGPSLDPAEKRLAVRTEDHPLEYLDFEAVIPAGQYGAGAMIAWDDGSVSYLDGGAEQGLTRGKLDFVLAGQKLGGRFALVRTKKEGEWLLFKKKDAHASGEDVLAKDARSVLSGLTVEELAAGGEVAARLQERALRLGARPGPVHANAVQPMLCATQPVPLDDPARLYELKLDGVRILAERDAGRVDLRYRKQRSATATYPEIARALLALPVDHVVLDGEIVALAPDGKPSFELLARRIHLSRPLDVARAAAELPVIYLAFDLLALGGYDLRRLPLSARKELLFLLLPGKGRIRALEHTAAGGGALLDFCREHALEGIVCKRADSPYRAGQRGHDWVKVKLRREDDFVITGWEQSEKRGLKSLLLGSYVDGALVARGQVGSGLTEAAIASLLAELGPIETARRGALVQVQPLWVASVEHQGFTADGALRAPVFRGLRADVDPNACTAAPGVERIEQAMASVQASQEGAARVELSNQDKLFWPDDGYVKGDLCRYYDAVAPALLPFLRERPAVLVRYPDGISGKSFYQWRVPVGAPSFLRSIELRDVDDVQARGEKRVFLIDSRDALLYVANLACIPLHVLGARAGSLQECDFLTLDFDLGEQPFSAAVELALDLRAILADVGLPGFPKTSGQTGLHVLIALGPGVGFDSAKLLIELCGRLLAARHPRLATMERRKEKRGGRVYLDTGQTGRSRTIVAPYSVRAVPGATVSTPLYWDELSAGLEPARWTLATVPARLAQIGDPIAGLLEARPDVAGAVAKLEKWARGCSLSG